MHRVAAKREGWRCLRFATGPLSLALAVLASASAASAQTPDDLRAEIEVYETAADNARCALDWTLLGGIAGFVSDHGRYGQPEGLGPIRTFERLDLRGDELQERINAIEPEPTPIVGRPLDGEAGRRLVPDTDHGELDGDSDLDRAVGPFQFLPSTWAIYASDGNGDDVSDPHDLADAASAAAWLLCDVGAADDETAALIRYFGTAVWLSNVNEARAALAAPLQATASAAQPTTEAPSDVPLVWVDGIQVHEEIAVDVAGLLEAALVDDIVLRGWGWRSHERQIELRAAHCADIWTTPASECSPPTARPGHSLHETGRAIDFYTDDQGTPRAITRQSPEFVWLSEHAERFGLFNLPSEPWHWSTSGR